MWHRRLALAAYPKSRSPELHLRSLFEHLWKIGNQTLQEDAPVFGEHELPGGFVFHVRWQYNLPP